MQVDLGRISNNQLVVSRVSFFSCRRFLIGFVHCPVTEHAATEIQYAACIFCQHSFVSSITRDAFNTPTQKQSFPACPAALTVGPQVRLNEYRVRWFDEVVVKVRKTAERQQIFSHYEASAHSIQTGPFARVYRMIANDLLSFLTRFPHTEKFISDTVWSP